MEEFFGLIFVLIFFGIKIAVSVRKSNQSSENSSSNTGGSSLKTILDAVKTEFSDAVTPNEPYSEENEAFYDEDSMEQDEVIQTSGNYEEQMEQATRELIYEKSRNVEMPPARSFNETVDGDKLKQAIIWKEILDKPLSIR